LADLDQSFQLFSESSRRNPDWNLQVWLTRAGRQVKLIQSFRLETGFL